MVVITDHGLPDGNDFLVKFDEMLTESGPHCIVDSVADAIVSSQVRARADAPPRFAVVGAGGAAGPGRSFEGLGEDLQVLAYADAVLAAAGGVAVVVRVVDAHLAGGAFGAVRTAAVGDRRLHADAEAVGAAGVGVAAVARIVDARLVSRAVEARDASAGDGVAGLAMSGAVAVALGRIAVVGAVVAALQPLGAEQADRAGAGDEVGRVALAGVGRFLIAGEAEGKGERDPGEVLVLGTHVFSLTRPRASATRKASGQRRERAYRGEKSK